MVVDADLASIARAMDDFDQALQDQYATEKIFLTAAERPKRERHFCQEERHFCRTRKLRPRLEAMLVQACMDSKNLQIKDLDSYEPTLANMDKFGIIDLTQATSRVDLFIRKKA